MRSAAVRDTAEIDQKRISQFKHLFSPLCVLKPVRLRFCVIFVSYKVCLSVLRWYIL